MVRQRPENLSGGRQPGAEMASLFIVGSLVSAVQNAAKRDAASSSLSRIIIARKTFSLMFLLPCRSSFLVSRQSGLVNKNQVD